MALPKKNFKCVQMLLAVAAVPFDRCFRSVPKAVKKKLG